MTDRRSEKMKLRMGSANASERGVRRLLFVFFLAAGAQAGDVVRVTCRHDVSKRRTDQHGAPKTPRYVLWGEGTTDEMCLGILQVARD